MSDPFIGQIQMACYSFVPTGWLACNGQTAPINQYQALFVVLGGVFGYNQAQNNFTLPNLQGQVAIGMGQGTGLANRVFGAAIGEETVTLQQPQMPTHNHLLNGCIPNDTTTQNETGTPSSSVQFAFAQQGTGAASTTVNAYNGADAVNSALGPLALTAAGSTQPHENRQSYLAIPFFIAVEGVYPSAD